MFTREPITTARESITTAREAIPTARESITTAQQPITAEPGLSGRVGCGIERACDYDSGFSSETS